LAGINQAAPFLALWFLSTSLRGSHISEFSTNALGVISDPFQQTSDQIPSQFLPIEAFCVSVD
jgi:hypothetical protein